MGQNEERNGVTRPGAGSTGSVIWTKADELSAAKGDPCTKEEILAALPALKASTVSVEYSKWRKWYGLPAKRVARSKEGCAVLATGSAPRMNPQPPYVESDVVNGYQLKDNAWVPYTPPAPAPVPPPPPPVPVAPPPSFPPVAPPSPPPSPPAQLSTAAVQKQPPASGPRIWKKGDVVNGHMYDGENWVPVNTQRQPPVAPTVPAPPPVFSAPPPPPPPAPLPPPPPAPLPPPPPAPLPPPTPAPVVPPAPPAFKVGDRANGHVLTATGWVLDAAPTGAPAIEVVGEDP
jgi:hypothetical protein